MTKLGNILGNFSLNNQFGSLLNRYWKAVPNEEFHDIYNRFTYIHPDQDGNLRKTDKSGQKMGSWTFSRGNDLEIIGLLQDNGHIYDQSGKLVAHRVGQFGSFHDYTCGCLFSGIWNEFICQMPEQYKIRT